ncbi:19595_t:CDS:2, partial [Entrophospora sp. SA101]
PKKHAQEKSVGTSSGQKPLSISKKSTEDEDKKIDVPIMPIIISESSASSSTITSINTNEIVNDVVVNNSIKNLLSSGEDLEAIYQKVMQRLSLNNIRV